jgi:hypothetical protein
MAGSLIKIDEEIVTSAVASVTLGGADWDSSYDVYMVTSTNVIPSTDGADLQMRFTESGTANSTSNYDHAFKFLTANTAFGNSSITNQINLIYLEVLEMQQGKVYHKFNTSLMQTILVSTVFLLLSNLICLVVVIITEIKVVEYLQSVVQLMEYIILWIQVT